MCSVLFVAAPRQRQRIYVYVHTYGTLCIHVHYMYITHAFMSTFISTSIYLSIMGSHHYLQFQSETTEVIVVFFPVQTPYSASPSLPPRSLSWRCPPPRAGLQYAKPGQFHPCAEIPSPPQSSSDMWCQASKHAPHSS